MKRRTWILAGLATLVVAVAATAFLMDPCAFLCPKEASYGYTIMETSPTDFSVHLDRSNLSQEIPILVWYLDQVKGHGPVRVDDEHEKEIATYLSSKTDMAHRDWRLFDVDVTYFLIDLDPII